MYTSREALQEQESTWEEKWLTRESAAQQLHIIDLPRLNINQISFPGKGKGLGMLKWRMKS